MKHIPVTLGGHPWRPEALKAKHAISQPAFDTRQQALEWAAKRCDELNKQVSNC